MSSFLMVRLSDAQFFLKSTIQIPDLYSDPHCYSNSKMNVDDKKKSVLSTDSNTKNTI
jgi:hypothetical protein